MKLRYRVLLASVPVSLALLIGSAPSWPSAAGVEVPLQLSGFISGVLLTAALLLVTGLPSFAAAPRSTADIPQDQAFLGNLIRATAELEAQEAEAGTSRTEKDGDRRPLQNSTDAAHQSATGHLQVQNLQNEIDRLQLILDSATGLAVMAFDDAGVVTFFNTGAERMFGYLAGEVTGLANVEWFIEGEELSRRREGAADRLGRPASPIEGLAEVLRYRNEDETTITYLHKAGNRFTGQVSLSRLRDSTGVSSGLLAVSRDVTRLSYKVPGRKTTLAASANSRRSRVSPAPAPVSADQLFLQDHLERFGKEDPELARNLAHSFLNDSPVAFERLIATVLSQRWAEAGDAVRELRSGACRMLVPELDLYLKQIENSLLNETPNSDDVPIEPAFALYQLARAVTRDWLGLGNSDGGTPESPSCLDSPSHRHYADC